MTAGIVHVRTLGPVGRAAVLPATLCPEQIELQRTRLLKGECGVTHLHYRVQR